MATTKEARGIQHYCNASCLFMSAVDAFRDEGKGRFGLEATPPGFHTQIRSFSS
jgi:hypothetical protein